MTIDELKPYLNVNIDDDRYDSKIEGLYNVAKVIFTQRTRCNLSLSTEEEKFIEFEGDRIYPNNTPVNSVSSIIYYTDIGEDSIEITDYLLANNAIYLKDSVTSKYLTLSYSAGYSTIPEAIDQVLVKIVSFWWNFDDQKTQLTSSGEALLTPDDITLPRELKDAIAVYRIGL